MLPSEFFALLPGVSPAVLNLPEVEMDERDEAVNAVKAIEGAALVDWAELTGLDTWPREGDTAQDRLHREVFLSLLMGAALRYRKYQTGLDAVKMHNPDVPQNVAFNLDLVRVIGRAERSAMQRARKLLRGNRWLTRLVSGHAQH